MARKPSVIVAASPALSATLLAVLSGVAAAMSTPPGYALLTQAEGEEAVTAGLAALVDGVIVDDKAGVVLTEAGQAALAAASAPPVAPTVAADAFVIEDNIPIPGAKRGGRGNTVYPFEQLGVNQSFHVAATPENPNPAKSLASTVSSATARYAVEVPGVTETVTLPVYQVGADGKKTKDAAGNWIKTGDKTEVRQKMKNTRVFTLRGVDDTDPKGKGARVWRTA